MRNVGSMAARYESAWKCLSVFPVQFLRGGGTPFFLGFRRNLGCLSQSGSLQGGDDGFEGLC